MADKKITELPASAGLVSTDLVAVVDDPSGTPATQKATLAQVATVVEAANAAATRTPVAHASTHATAGSDPIAPADIGAATASAVATAQAAADAAQAAADAAQGDATTALAAATGAQSVRLITTNASITASDLGKLLLVAVSGSDITLTFGDDVLATHAFTVVRSYTSGTDPGGAVIFAGASGTHNFAGSARLSSSQSMIRMVLAAIDGTTRYWQSEREAAHLYIPIAAAHNASTKTLATYESGRHQALDTSSNSIEISIPDTLRAGFVWTGRKSSASNSVTFATGSGLITPTFYGSSTITANGALICVFVESSSVAAVFVTVPA